MVSRFSQQIVAWQTAHGRHHLPWQNTQDAYRVWLSEIMLQQTQVSTVLGYYDRFLQRCPTVADLAAASDEDVMALWSGLGYYSRARNLHRCAKEVMDRFAGAFPHTVEELSSLPGIGRSTAGAIASFCFAQRAAILDANVKRVLTRVLGFEDDLASSAAEKKLWLLAESLLPTTDLAQNMPRYTQGMMDMGATICTSKKPSCLLCPVHSDCVAHRQGQPERYPVKTKKLKRSAASWWLLCWQRPDGAIWLEKRPAPGIWAGLFCMPVLGSEDALLAQSAQNGASSAPEHGTAFLHVLTHKDLHLHPVRVPVPADFVPAQAGQWCLPAQWPDMGLPAPVRSLLQRGF
ncbi:MAG: A/G-specific adenine glycosylase [Comamonas sp.]